MPNTPRADTPLDRPGFNFAVSLMQYLVVPTFVLDGLGQVLIWNKACERLTGVPASEVLGTRDHWRAFYREPRPCLADLVAQQRMAEIEKLYLAHHDAVQPHGVRAENWCVMPRLGRELYLAIDVGPIYDDEGQLVAVVETLRDKTEEHHAKQELERLATRDGLTGLLNRRQFDHVLSNEWQRMRRTHQPLSLLMVDVDHFKRYNDHYGHPAGDACLKQVAQALQHALLRPSDVAARYGGEEFALVLPDTDADGVETVARRIQVAVDALGLAHASGEGGRVTLSMGMASVQPDGQTQAEQLLLMADEALYRAKHAGRNRFVLRSVPGG